MRKILFVCHGNICRSVMAEYIFKSIDNNKYFVSSCATTTEEIGNDIYPPIKEVLTKHNISYGVHKARVVSIDDYYNYDYIVCMDSENIRDLRRILPNSDKTRLLSYKEIDDPWYSRNFEKCFIEIYDGVKQLISDLDENKL